MSDGDPYDADGDPYDADGDVDRYLNFPSPEDHPYGLSEPAEGTLGGHFQFAPATEQAFPAAPQTLPASATEIHGQPPPDDSGIQLPATGIHGHPAPQTQNVAPAIYGAEHYETAPSMNGQHYEMAPATNGAEHYEMAPLMNGEHYEAAPINNNAEQYEAPAINAFDDHHMAGMDVEPQYEDMAMDVQPTHMLNPEMQQGFGGFPDPTLLQGGGGVHGEHYQYQAPIMDAAYHYAAPPPINGEHYQPPIMNAEHHQVPAMDDMGQYEEAMAVDIQQPAHMVGSETQQADGLPEPTPMEGVGDVDAVDYEAPGFNGEHHQVQSMAIDVVEPPTHTPAPEPQMPQQQGGGGGVDGAPWLEGESMFPPPSPTMCRMLDELAAMIQATGGAEGNAGGDAEAAAPDDVGPAEEDVTFKPIIPGRLDCGRCSSVREVLALHGVSKIHFAVHTAYPETFEHAIIDRRIMDPDGIFRTKVLLYLDLRGRRPEWVQNFIEKSVEKMKTKNAGLVQDSCGPSTSYGALAVGDDNTTSAAVGGNNITAPPQPSNHGHMELEVGMLNHLLSDTTAPNSTADQAAIPEAAQPPQAQGNTDAPPVSEAAIPEATQAVVTQAQGNSNAPSVAEAAQPAVITQAQENTDAPPSVAEAAAPPEATQPSATQAAAQENPDAPSAADGAAVPAAAAEPAADDALDRFPPFNWDGFRPDHILESSQVPPYDPASGVDVLMYPSMQEHLRVEALKREEGKKLSKMTIEDTPDYLNINDDHLANAPNFASALFKLLCQKDPTYRLFKRRVSGLNRRIKKLEEGATKVGTGGLFKIKQKMETFKEEKEELYEVIHRGMQELENAGRNDDGAGPSNRPGPSNSTAPSSNGTAGPSSNVAAGTSNAAGPSNVAGDSNDDAAGPSNVAGTSNEDAGPSSSTAGPSNVAAGPSGTK